jgi:hypothetical protein
VSVQSTVVPTEKATDATPDGSVAVACSTKALFFGTVAPDGAVMVTVGPLVSDGVVAVTVNGAEELPACTASPAYTAVTVRVPAVVGVYATEHVAVVPAPAGEQVAGANVPDTLEDHETDPEPPGGEAVPPEVSVTVAVHVVEEPATTVVPHVTEVDVPRFVAVTVTTPELTPCAPSPP